MTDFNGGSNSHSSTVIRLPSTSPHVPQDGRYGGPQSFLRPTLCSLCLYSSFVFGVGSNYGTSMPEGSCHNDRRCLYLQSGYIDPTARLRPLKFHRKVRQAD